MDALLPMNGSGQGDAVCDCLRLVQLLPLPETE